MSTMKRTVTIGGLTLSVLTPSSNQQTRMGGGVCPACSAVHVLATGQNLDVAAKLGIKSPVFSTVELRIRPSELAELAAFLCELAATAAENEAAGTTATQPSPVGCS